MGSRRGMLSVAPSLLRRLPQQAPRTSATVLCAWSTRSSRRAQTEHVEAIRQDALQSVPRQACGPDDGSDGQQPLQIPGRAPDRDETRSIHSTASQVPSAALVLMRPLTRTSLEIMGTRARRFGEQAPTVDRPRGWFDRWRKAPTA